MIVADNEHARVLIPPVADAELEAGRTDLSGVVDVDLDDGGVRWSEGAAADRPGPREVRVELRVAPTVEPHELEATMVDPERYRIIFENDAVRVVRLGFDAGEEGLMVHHPPRVLITLTDVHVGMELEDGKTDEARAEPGQAAWLEAQTLKTANAGRARLEVVLVEPKAINGEEK